LEALKIILPVVAALLSSALSVVVTLRTVRRNRVDVQDDRKDDRHAELKREERALTWELRKDDHASTQRLLDRIDQACSEISRKPCTAAELEERGMRQMVLELSQTVRKMPVDAEARDTLQHLLTHLACIEAGPLPDGVRTGGRVHVETAVHAACTQGREAAHALDYIAGAREDVTSLWGPPIPAG
jgi:hypothetical protein